MARQSREQEIRRITSDDGILVEILRDFLLRALRHPAITDVLIERMAYQAECGHFDSNSLSAVLPQLIGEVVKAATDADWRAIADVLIEDLVEACSGGVE